MSNLSVPTEPTAGDLTAEDIAMIARLGKTISSLDDSVPTLKALLYGNSGVGKTIEALAILQRIVPKDQLILYIDTGEGWVSAQNHPKLKSRVDRVVFVSYSQIEAFIDMLKRRVGPYANYGGIIIDEYSTVSDQVLDKITADKAAVDKSKDPDAPELHGYKILVNMMKRLTDKLVGIQGLHVIITAHERFDKASNNIIMTGPAFLPSLSDKIRQKMNLVAHMDSNEITTEEGLSYQRTLQVHPRGQVSAKTRIGNLNPVVIHKELMSSMTGWLNGSVADVEPKHQPEVIEGTVEDTTNLDEGMDPIQESE